ncbi:unnamed protein product [Rhizophagus irregularis]|nr:unnamed protein product [Rhizophagus irregularis]CAB5383499.1 unnamed protein product [Rhizophagus irregularis]
MTPATLLSYLQNNIRGESFSPVPQNNRSNPVITPSGHSYDRKALERWLRNKPYDPQTRQPLTIDQVYENRNLKDAIVHYRNNFLRFMVPIQTNM